MRFPAAPEAPTDEALRAVPVFEVFGSDELSAEASAIQERMPQAYVLLHPTDAARLGIDAGDGVRDSAGQARFVAGLDADVPVGHVYYGSGLAGAWPVPPEGPVTLEVDPDYEPPDVIARG
jgi:NADH-quinone oxidoreductase subunit G